MRTPRAAAVGLPFPSVTSKRMLPFSPGRYVSLSEVTDTCAGEELTSQRSVCFQKSSEVWSSESINICQSHALPVANAMVRPRPYR